MVLLAEIMGERGIVPATVEAVEEAADIACALRSLHRWDLLTKTVMQSYL